MKHKTLAGQRVKISHLIVIGVVAAACYVILPQIGSFKTSWHYVQQPDWLQVALSVGCLLMTYLAAALTYVCLAFRHLDYVRTVLVQVASMFVNRILPSGIGALGINYAYLRKQRHARLETGVVLAANNILGVAGHTLLFAVMVGVFHASSGLLAHRRLHVSSTAVWAVIALLVVSLTVGVALRSQKILSAVRQGFQQVARYKQRPGRLFLALLSSVLLTMSNVGCLWFACHATGVALPFAAAFIIFSVGLGVGTATPSPGGLGTTEVGLLAGMLAYGVPQAPALGAVLLYRLISYWLPLLLGSIAFVWCQSNRFFTAKY